MALFGNLGGASKTNQGGEEKKEPNIFFGAISKKVRRRYKDAMKKELGSDFESVRAEFEKYRGSPVVGPGDIYTDKEYADPIHKKLRKDDGLLRRYAADLYYEQVGDELKKYKERMRQVSSGARSAPTGLASRRFRGGANIRRPRLRSMLGVG